MRITKKHGVRILAAILTLSLILGLLAMIPMGVSAAGTDRKSYKIAIVLDNSGSMYNNTAWCQAKFAVEIFASMLDYAAGDRLWLFPMWEVTTDGSSKKGGSYSPVEINSKEAIDKISNMYCTNPNQTPFAPVLEAQKFLEGQQADEKWLIVMTDGGFNQVKRGNMEPVDPQSRLSQIASKNLKVQYIGFGSATKIYPNEQNGLYVSSENDTLPNRLIDTCNLIFQRNVLPADRLQGDKLTLDISTKNLVVFAQGDVQVSSLKDSSGAAVSVVMDSGQRKFSEIKASGREDAPVDTSLAGRVVTFSACAKGEYTLTYSGNDKDTIRIFYEPDVELKVSMVDADGQPVDTTSGELIAGDYTIQAQLLDRVTGEDVSNHPLMGNVKIQTYVKPNGAGQAVPYPNGSTITLEPDQKTEIYVQADYLDKYSISTKDDPKSFAINWHILPQLQFDIAMQVQQPNNWYGLLSHEKWQPVKVTLTVDGQPLTAEQLQNTQFTFGCDPELLIRQEDLGNGEYLLHIAQNENGEYQKPDTGKYTITVKGVHTDENGRVFERTADAKIVISLIERGWIPYIVILGIVLLLLLIHLIRNIPVYPASVSICKVLARGLSEPEGQNVYKAFSLEYGTLGILSGEAVKSTPLCKRSGSGASLKLKNVSAGQGNYRMRISGQRIPEDTTEVELTDGDIIIFERGENRTELQFEVLINREHDNEEE